MSLKARRSLSRSTTAARTCSSSGRRARSWPAPCRLAQRRSCSASHGAVRWPDLVAHMVATAEIGLPVLLVLGLATRFAALALLVMTGVIQLVVPEGWANFHIHWAAEAIAIIALGPGRLSLDHLIARWR